jgi:hypothetical protein
MLATAMLTNPPARKRTLWLSSSASRDLGPLAITPGPMFKAFAALDANNGRPDA